LFGGKSRFCDFCYNLIVPLEYELINLLDGDCRIELTKVLSQKDFDSVLRVPMHSIVSLNAANVSQYFNYPKTIPVAFRRKKTIEAFIVGVPVEKYIDDETFPDPDIGRRNTIYSAIIAYSDTRTYNKLVADYRIYLSKFNATFESRHLRTDWAKGSEFEVVKVFDYWKIDGVPVAYCKHRFAEGSKK